jgi:DNA polymerase elongation subunit (family B)
VPELGYNICEKRKGIVPKTLSLLLEKRLKYKGLVRETDDERLGHVYNMRQGALKWILVTCFGYLGYRNARFGKVDAHIAVCAFARDYLLKAARMAEEAGFEVVHGIVDSLWLKKKGASPQEVAKLCQAVSKAVGVQLSVEGKYRWIVFLPSKILSDIPVLNRYYGVFENGCTKMRGIEARRGDTPKFICEAQIGMINKLASASDEEEFKAKIPEALDIIRGYVKRLVSGNVDAQDLLVTKRLSKKTSSYTHDVLQAIAARQLEKAGFEVNAGQMVRYVVADAKCRNADGRVVVSQLLTENTKYDVHTYTGMLCEAAETLFGFLGYTEDRIKTAVLYREKQMVLK